MENLQKNIKEKYRDIAGNPGRIFGLVYPFMLTIGVIIGLIYLEHLNQIGNNQIAPRGTDKSAVIEEDLKIVEPQTVPAINITEAGNTTPQILEQGKTLYSNMCQSCHGASGAGDGPGATGLNPQPRNLTSNEGWKNGASLSGIYGTLQNGIPGTAMVSYDYLLPEEKIAIAHFIRETFVSNPPPSTQEELITMDQTYQLSQGKEIAAQIPVSAAIEIKLRENNSTIQKVNEVLRRLEEDRNSEGARILDNVVTNRARAISALAASDTWRGDAGNFLDFVVSNVNVNGFDGDVFNLNNDEWNALYIYVNSVF